VSVGPSLSAGHPRRGAALLVLLVIGVSAGLLYGTHLHDPLLFDSAYWFSESNLQTLRQLDSSDRYVSKTVAYWLYQLSGGRNEILRVASLGLHVATAFVLFLLLRRLAPLILTGSRTTSPASNTGAAIALAALFTLHPVQVYAVAYHGQMEIVLATLFGMLMLVAYLEGLERSSRGLLLLSVLLYLLAVLSKENLAGMPAVALAMTLLLRRPSRALLRLIWPCFGLCLLIAVWIVARELAEPRQAAHLGEMAAAAGPAAAPAFAAERLHLRSIVTQGYLFFRYLLLWLVPNVGWMSIDLQYPLASSLFAWPESAGFVAFCLYPIAAAWLLLRRGRAGLVGLGLLWPWLLFLPELSTTRLTEVFVLYRGYPWIGGFLLALVVGGVPWLGRAAVPLLALACLGLAVLAHERLATFRSAHAIWNDAVEKNRPYERRAAGAYRAYVNRGTAQLDDGRAEAALRDFETALELKPGLPYASLNAGLAYIRLGRYPEALRALDEGIANAGLMPATAQAAAYSNRAGLYLLLARPRDAVEDLAKAASLDPARAEYQSNLERLRAETGAVR
jgi:tetratricopeptide (TPR) repeat protein